MKTYESNNAIIPVKKLEEDCYNWDERHQDKMNQVNSGQFDLLFTGDSITHFWELRSPEVWKEFFGKYKALNLGFGWDRTQNVLWRLGNGEFEKQSPKVFVLNIGSNNFYGTVNARSNSPEEVFEAIKMIMALIHEKSPDTLIIQMSILPRTDVSDEGCRNIHALNKMLAEYLKGRRNTLFLDIYKDFLGPDGNLNPVLYTADRCHISDEGYKVWGKALAPLLAGKLEQ